MILYSNLFTIIKNPEFLLISKLVFSFDDSFLDSPSSQGQCKSRNRRYWRLDFQFHLNQAPPSTTLS